ncbi:unnamed protein product [Aureobasidium vineae]|uniref:Aminoglycoside phosphotransferase domain-containing protein n=1 Tax=Aureobasidium vineae TaxID=2773715 RepID=A0A9N8J9J0_9PEZI|nr:unnamed protein product [Aureobasidium vineae]
MRRIHAPTIDQAWIDFSCQQRLSIAEEVAQYTALVATKTSNHLQTVSGRGVCIPSLMQGHPQESPIHHWFPRTVGPMSSVQYRAYMKSISSHLPPEFADDLVLYHDDQGPTNISISNDGNSVATIIDWANVAYLPRFWVATAPLTVAGFMLEDDKPPMSARGGWGRMLSTALTAQGFQECVPEYRAWINKVFKSDTAKDLAEWVTRTLPFPLFLHQQRILRYSTNAPFASKKTR